MTIPTRVEINQMLLQVPEDVGEADYAGDIDEGGRGCRRCVGEDFGSDHYLWW